jgi:GNAT superfamily N-acetyltransferase
MENIRLRAMEPSDRIEVAELICVSTNYWYQMRSGPPIFTAGPESTEVFCDIYESLDPGCCVVAQNPSNGRLMGSCFYHPREHHVSLGIMNVHPNYFRQGVAAALLAHVVDYADRHEFRAVRLTSSAMNLDSYSLYTRAGFVPRSSYQDMIMDVPESGFPYSTPNHDRVRAAREQDVQAMKAIELEVAGICREKDYRHCIRNLEGIWETLVFEGEDRELSAFMISCKHSALNMFGPCVARTEAQAAALIARAASRFRGTYAIAVVPAPCATLVQQMYQWKARNCELHFCQVRGDFQPFRGVSMPTFMLETA